MVSHDPVPHRFLRPWEGIEKFGEQPPMAAFVSTVTGKIDAKGRVSVPAVFRAAIASDGGDAGGTGAGGIFVYPSFTERAVEGGGSSLIRDVLRMVDELELFGEERDAIAASLFAEGHHLTFDAAGRVSLPESLLAHAGIEDTLCFVGLGSKFQIWNPDDYAVFREKARALAFKNRNLLKPYRSGLSGS